MAGVSCQLSFLAQIQNARTEIATNFGRLLQNVNALQARLLKELDRLEEDYLREKQDEAELRRLAQQLSNSFQSSLSAITRRIEQLVIEKRAKVLVLDWDIGTEQVLLNQFCRINVKKLPTDFSEEDTIPTTAYADYDSEPEIEETYDGVDNNTSSSEEALTLEQEYKLIDSPTYTCGSKGCLPGELDDPRGVSINHTTDEVYVADYNNHRIVIFDREGSYQREFTHKRMVGPIGVCVSGSLDRVYITLEVRKAVHCYKLDGTFLKEILTYSPSGTYFDTPSGIAMGFGGDGSERVYVCDRGNNRVPVFNKYLVYMTSLATHLISPRDVQVQGSAVAILHAGMYVVSFYSRGGMFLRNVVKKGDNKQKVENPYFFCIDSDKNILITDTDNDCVKVYRETGFHICNIGSVGDSLGEFREPSGIALFDDNSIVTFCDRDDDQLQIFSL